MNKKILSFSISLIIIVILLIVVFFIWNSSRLYSEKKVTKEFSKHSEEILILREFFFEKISDNPGYNLNITRDIKTGKLKWSSGDEKIDELVNSLLYNTIFEQLIIYSGEVELLTDKRTLDFCNGIAFSYYDSFALQDETTIYTPISDNIFYYESNMNR